MQDSNEARLRFDWRIDESTSPFDAAAEYVRGGAYPVFLHGIIDGTCTCRDGKECRSPGKHPVLRAWQSSLVADETILRDQFSRLRIKAPNIGLALGEQRTGEYLVAIDVDDQARCDVLIQKLGGFPATPRCDSGRGYRLFFCLPAGVPQGRVKNVTALGGEKGVDVKVKGGQVVVAPSPHINGKRYAWVAETLGEIAELPMAWTNEIVEEPKPPPYVRDYTPESIRSDAAAKKKLERYIQKAVVEECGRISRMPEGMRNAYLHRKAISLLALVNGCFLFSFWEYVLRELFKAGRAAGLPDNEVRRTLASAEAYVKREGATRGPRPVTEYTDESKSSDAASQEGTQSATEEEITGPTIELVQDNGQNAAIAENVARLLAQHPDWNGGPGLDAYSDRIYWPSPRPYVVSAGVGGYTKTDRAAVQGWCVQHKVRAGADTVEEGIRVAAKRRVFDSLITWLNALPPWDGTPRLDAWLITYFGCKDTPYHRMTGRSWLRACVERGYQPGLLVDIVPILQGNQRANKNYAISTLFHSERLDAPWMSIMGKFDPERLELKRLVTSRWILHDDEFKARDPKKLDEMKSWVSKIDEQYMAKYENDITVRPRRALLICSTNESQYLYDHTGNRRWIKWEVGTIDVAAIARDRLQLFAEAKQSAPWREGLDYDVIEAESEGAEVVDPLRDRLLQLANQPVLLPSGGYTHPLWRGWQTANTIADWLNIPSAHADQAFSMRLGRAVSDVGGRVKRTGRGKRCIRFYFPPTLIDQAAVAAELAEEKD